jgi:hypothetical protein
MTKPEIRRVPGDYAPDYPAGLTREQFEALLAGDARARILKTAAAAGLALGAALPAQKPGGEREPKMLAVLRTLAGDSGGWLERADFRRTRNAFDSPVVVPIIPISFGNSHNGLFDAERARQLARAMFSAYGLNAGAGHRVAADGVEARLDGYDPAAGVGFKLRGRAPKSNAMFAVPEPEDASSDLDPAEHAALAAKGVRVHVAELEQYPLMDGDQLTPTLAYLAGIVDFLNAVTGGELDLEAILMARSQRFPLADALDAPATVAVASDPYGFRLQTKARAQLLLRVDPRRGVEVAADTGRTAWVEAKEPLATRGRPTVLRLGFGAQGEGAKATLRVTQEAAVPVHVESTGGTVFLPSAFDATKPFQLTLEVEPGDYWLESHVRVGAGR